MLNFYPESFTPPNDDFEHQNQLRYTPEVLHVDFSEKLKFTQSCSKCVQGVFKYLDYHNDLKIATMTS